MLLPSVPTKTPLGQEELRRRTSGLGQRHRTILFLIDGRRPLAEVLSLALKAGASTSHFEDLVRLGYVELPPEEAAPEPEAPIETVSGTIDGEIRALEVEVPAEPADAPLDAAGEPDTAPEAGPDAEPDLAPEPAATPPAAPQAAPLPPPRPPVPIARTTILPRKPAAAAAKDDLPLLEQVRTNLLEALRFDAQLSGTRIAERARQAPTLAELVEVVWIMERGLSHSKRSHRGLLALQRARELLGLGNTLVDEESRPGRLDDDW